MLFAEMRRPSITCRVEARSGALAKKLRRRSKRSLREISAALAKAGHVNERGKPFSAMSVKNMVTR
jgi:hypothetical protein